jgi:hypothetical protein
MSITDAIRGILHLKKEECRIVAIEEAKAIKTYHAPLSDQDRKEIADELIKELDAQAKSWYGTGGCLITDAPIEGVTQGVSVAEEEYYGGKYFIAESMSEGAAKKISEVLGLEYQGKKED